MDTVRIETKPVNLIVAGGPSDGHRPLMITPSMTANDILAEQNLQDYQLSVGQNKPFLAGSENVYDQVEPGGKLYATTRATQG